MTGGARAASLRETQAREGGEGPSSGIPSLTTHLRAQDNHGIIAVSGSWRRLESDFGVRLKENVTRACLGVEEPKKAAEIRTPTMGPQGPLTVEGGVAQKCCVRRVCPGRVWPGMDMRDSSSGSTDRVPWPATCAAYMY